MHKLVPVNAAASFQKLQPALAVAKKTLLAPWARIVIPIAVFAAVFMVSACFVGSAKPTYTASARIWVQPYQYSMGSSKDDDSSSSSSNTPFNTGPNALVTASEIMHSESVAAIAHDMLLKDLGASTPSVMEIKSGVKDNIVMVTGDKTDILEAKYSDKDSARSVKILSAIVNAFFEENNRQASTPLQQSKAKLEQQLKMAREQYSKSKQKVQQFQDATSMLDFEKDAAVLSSDRADLEREVTKTQNEINALKGKLAYDEKQLGFGPQDVLSFQKLASDEVLTGLRQSIAETQVKLVDLRSKYQDEHPKIKRLKSQLEEAKKEMNERSTQLLGTNEHKIDVLASSDAQSSLIDDMVESNTSLVALEATQRSLNSSLSKVRSKLAGLPSRVKELADIHRQDDLATGSLTSIERALQRVRLNESVADGCKNLQIIDAPSMQSSSTPTTWTICVGFSVFAALLTAGLQFLFAPKYISAKKLDTLAPGRVTGFIPALKGDALGFSLSADRLRRALGDWLNRDSVIPIVITSSDKGDGKSTVAYRLAESLADSGSKVLLIDADCKHPTLHQFVNISASPGLVQYLAHSDVDSVHTMNAIKPGLTVIPAGGVTDAPVLKHPRFTALLKEFSNTFDAILIDSTECGDGLESLALPDLQCKVLVMVRLGASIAGRVSNTIVQLDMVSTLDWGIVANNANQNDIKLLRQGAKANQNVSSVSTPLSAGSEDSMVANW